MTPRDALDGYIFSRGPAKDELRWPAFTAAWGRIGKDFAVGYLFWCATGEVFRDGASYGVEPASDEHRVLARRFLTDCGLTSEEAP